MSAKLRIAAFIGAFAFCAAALPAQSAWAQEQKQQIKRKFKDKIHVVQPKPVLQKGRFELSPRFGMTVNDSVTRNFKVGVNANFHIMEPLYIGGVFEWYDFGSALGGSTDVFEQVQNQTGTIPEGAVLNWFGGLELGYVPFWGKFALFNRTIAFYDFAVTVGGGGVNAKSLQIPTAYTTGGGTISLSGRVFFNKWIALSLEVRDVIFLATLQNASGALTNIASVGLGASFFLPTSFEYSEKVIEVPGS